ncbi:hypothetical protein DTB58_27745, partial [Streptomyces griseus]|uniref:ferredoxin n=1 Tax=Streptomyces griseus TaxID=1911 RepID=UPI001C5738E1
MGDRWHVEVDRSVCIGSGMCVNHAGDAFHLDSARQSRPTDEDCDAGEHVLLRRAGLAGGGAAGRRP